MVKLRIALDNLEYRFRRLTCVVLNHDWQKKQTIGSALMLHVCHRCGTIDYLN